MTVLQAPGGRLLRSRPAGLPFRSSWAGTPPMWSDGERWGSDGGRLASFAEIYNSQPVVNAVVNKISRQIATLPLHAYEKNGTTLNRVDDAHPLAMLLARPYSRRSSFDLQQWMSFPVLVHGNGLIAKYRADPEGPPTMLIPLDWAQASAFAAQGAPVEWWSTFQFGSDERFLPADDAMHFAWHATCGDIGRSPLEALGVTIRLEDAAQRYQTASFRNGARPGGVVTLPSGANPTEEQIALTRQTIENMHKGVDQGFRVGLLAPGADWKPMTMSAVEAELISQRSVNRAEIAMVYDVDPPLIGDLEHGTYSNVAELLKAFFKITLPPWLALIENVLNSQLIAPEPEWQGLVVKFDLSEQLKGEPAELATTLQTEIATGVRTPNEGRDRLGLPRDENPAADKLYLPVNNLQPVGTETPANPQAISDGTPQRIRVVRDAQGNPTDYIKE